MSRPSSALGWWNHWLLSEKGGSREQELEYLDKQVVNNELHLKRCRSGVTNYNLYKGHVTQITVNG